MAACHVVVPLGYVHTHTKSNLTLTCYMVCAGWDRKLRNTIYHYMHTHPRQPPQPDPDHNKEPLLYMRKAQVSMLHLSRYIRSVLGKHPLLFLFADLTIFRSVHSPFKISILCLGNMPFFCFLFFADLTIFSLTLNQLCCVQNIVPFDAIIWLSCELKLQFLLKRKQL